MACAKKEPIGIKMLRSGTKTLIRIFLVVGLAFCIPIIGNAVFSNQITKNYSGSILDPTDALTDDEIRYSFELNSASMTVEDNAITINASVTDGVATLYGILGLKRKNKGLLGWIERSFSEKIRETGQFAGNAKITLVPQAVDGKITFTNEVLVDVTTAKAKLFGKFIRISARSYLEKELTKKIKRELAKFESGVAIKDIPALVTAQLSAEHSI